MTKRLFPIALALLCCVAWVACKKQKTASGTGSASANASGGSAKASASAGSASGAGTAKAASGSAKSAGTGSADGDDDGSSSGSAVSSAKAKPVAPDALFARLLTAIKLKKPQRQKLEALAASYKGKPASAANHKAIGAALGKILEENQLIAYQLIVDEMGKAAK